MAVEAQGAARWRDFFMSSGDLPLGRGRYRALALFRLCAIPIAILPTQFWLRGSLEAAHEPEWGRVSVVLHLIFLGVYLVSSLWLFWSARAGAPERRTLWGTLSIVGCACELGTNQAYLLGFGSLANYSVGFLPMLIVMYRVLLDYRAGLWTLGVGLVAYIAVGLLEMSGSVPVAPLLPEAIAHPAWSNPEMSHLVLVSVVFICGSAFAVSNYGVNQSVRLHRYITDSVLYRYLPPTLVQRAAAGELRLDAPPERRVLTVMFTDVVGFTPLTERLGPEVIGRLLNRYLAEIADLAHQHGATIDKFIGDCVMIVFGAPEPLEPREQAERCVALAMAIHERVRALEMEHPLQARTGINTGEAVVGNFGSRARSDYTVLGPAVNIAARLESASAPGRVLLGEETARLLGDSVALEEAGSLQLKGVREPVNAYFLTEL